MYNMHLTHSVLQASYTYSVCCKFVCLYMCACVCLYTAMSLYHVMYVYVPCNCLCVYISVCLCTHPCVCVCVTVCTVHTYVLVSCMLGWSSPVRYGTQCTCGYLFLDCSSHLAQLEQWALRIFSRLQETLDDVPYGIRWLCKAIRVLVMVRTCGVVGV